MKSQSAMEYLTTYGWALLIIALVLVAFLGLNLFTPNYWTPKIQPGACNITRNSYGGAIFSGSCISGLPEFVTQFSGTGSYISLGNNKRLSPEAGANGQMSFCAWENVLSKTSYYGFLLKGDNAPSYGNSWEYAIGQGSSQIYIVWSQGGGNIAYYNQPIPNLNMWSFICGTYNHQSGNAYYYINGTSYTGTFIPGNVATAGTGNVILGAGENGFSNIELANVQMYNVSLSANSIQALYIEGIGGIPIDTQNLVGWWPLNGDAKDYSGNADNGASTNVIYVSNWYSNYAKP